MIYLIQIIRLLNEEQRYHFTKVFNDLSFEIDELGYEPSEIVNDLLFQEFGLEMEEQSQLDMLTDIIMKYQGKATQLMCMATIVIGEDFAA